MHPRHTHSRPTTRLLVIATTLTLSLLAFSANAARECSDDESGPLPDCVKVQYKGGGKINIDNRCDYAVDVKIDHSVDHDEVLHLEAHHQKMMVNRMVVKLFCCHATTPQCPQGKETSG